MWFPFRRRRESVFPKPKWPPIQELESIDIIGKIIGGGVDLCIVASQPLDDSVDTLERIRKKSQTYLETIEREDFLAEMDHPILDQITIVIACEHKIHPEAMKVIRECVDIAAAKGVRLELRKSM